MPCKHSDIEERGFSIIGLILLAAVLIGITVIGSGYITTDALNPVETLNSAYEVARIGDIRELSEAVYQWSLDNNAEYSLLNQGRGIPDVPTPIGSGPNDVDICADLLNIYLAKMPIDKEVETAYFTDCNDYSTGYTIHMSPVITSRVTVSSSIEIPGKDISRTK